MTNEGMLSIFKMKLADRVNQIEESGTVQFTLLLQQMRKAGRAVIDLAVGEPPFDSPPEVVEATKQALDRGRTKYGPVAGMQELKFQLARQFDGYDERNIIISNGSKQGLYSAFQAIINPADEVIIPRPYWVSFPQQVRFAGGRPVFVDTRSHQLDLERIEQAVSPRTRALLINSPNNPTGAVYPRQDLEKIAQLAAERDLFIIADEAYNSYIYDGRQPASLFDFEEIRPQLIITRSFSKTFNMTGFRVGYTAGPVSIIAALNKLQSHLTGNVCTFAQEGALAALTLESDETAPWQQDLEKKRDYAYRKVKDFFDCIKPGGAFYLFPDVSRHLDNELTSVDLTRRLLEETGVAVVPGEEFGQPGHIRISYAVSQQDLVNGLDKIAEAL